MHLSKRTTLLPTLCFVLTTLLFLGQNVEAFGCCIATVFSPDDDDDFVTREIFFPLRSMNATASIIDGIAEVSVYQFFETFTAEIIPPTADLVARYEIPIDREAAVHTFVAEYDDRIIQGVVKDIDQAREEFEEALEQGQSAFLGEQTRAGVFKIEFGNIPLNVLLKITLKYVTEVPALDENIFRFVIPSALAPELTAIPGDPEDLPFRNGVFDFYLEAFTSSGSISTSSPTHNVTVIDTDGGSSLALEDIDQMRRDVVILVETSEELQDFSVKVYTEDLGANNDGAGSAIMLSLLPDVSSANILPPPDGQFFIFVVDRSGSMGGERIHQTGIALRSALEILPVTAFFNIVGFGTNYEFLFEEPQSVGNPDAFAAGLAEADQLAADFGATYIRKPLEAIFEQQFPQAAQQNLFILTDGANIEDQNPGILEFVAENVGAYRIFSIGIGEPDINFIESVATLGGGWSEIVDNSDLALIQDVIKRQVEVSTSPVLEDINIDWGTGGIQAPYAISAAFDNRRALYFFLTDGPIPNDISVTAIVPGAAAQIQKTISRSNFTNSASLGQTTSVISKIAAKLAIQDLERGSSELHALNAGFEEIVNEIVRIGVKYQIASSQTSFIAVDNFNWTSTEGAASSATSIPAADIALILPAITLAPSTLEPTEAPSSSHSPSASPFAPNSNPQCFAGENSVKLLNGVTVALRDVQVGDIVESGYGLYSTVYGFGHKDDSHQQYTFLQIIMTKAVVPLDVSAHHMVLVAERGLVPANEIEAGDELVLSNGLTDHVREIRVVSRRGAYAPFTYSGTVVVNGVISSNYVSLQGSGSFVIGGFNIVSAHWLAHAMQSYRRILCAVHMDTCRKEVYTDNGMATWVVGPYKVAKWLVQQPGWILVLFAFPVILTACLAHVLELFITMSYNYVFIIFCLGTLSVAALRPKKKYASSKDV